MTPDLTKLAEEARIKVIEADGSVSYGHITFGSCIKALEQLQAQHEASRQAVVAETVERCAKVCDAYADFHNPTWVQPRHSIQHCAKEIRALAPPVEFLPDIPRKKFVFHNVGKQPESEDAPVESGMVLVPKTDLELAVDVFESSGRHWEIVQRWRSMLAAHDKD